MAVTILQQPNQDGNIVGEYRVHSAYRPITLQVESDAANIARMKMVVYNPSNEIARMIVDPDLGTTDRFTFEISTILQEYISNSLPGRNITRANQDSMSDNLICRFIEIYEVDGLLEEQTVFAATAYPFSTHLATLQHKEEQSLLPFRHRLITDTGVRFLTNAPTTKDIGMNESEWLSIIEMGAYPSGDFLKVRFTLHLVSGGTFQVQRVITSPSWWTVIGVGTANLPAWNIAPYSIADISRYDVQLVHQQGVSQVVVSETRTFNVRQYSCDTIRFHWLNRLGWWDSFTVDGRWVENIDTTSSKYRKALPANFSTEDRGDTDFNIEGSEGGEIGTPILSGEMMRWLQELKTSPSVYLDNGSIRYPIIITNKDAWELDSLETQPLKIKYMDANSLIIQRN